MASQIIDGYLEVKLMRREVMENDRKYWSNKQNDEDELDEADEVDEVESRTEWTFSTYFSEQSTSFLKCEVLHSFTRVK